jgi:hypothetical protein
MYPVMAAQDVAQAKTNKLIEVYLIDLWIDSCVDGSIFEKEIATAL